MRIARSPNQNQTFSNSTGDSAVIHITLPSGQILLMRARKFFDDDDAANDRTLTGRAVVLRSRSEIKSMELIHVRR